MRELDTDESGDLDLDEVISMKETWALEENKRSMISKVEVDAMKQGWSEKEERILGLYYSAKDELKSAMEKLSNAKNKRGTGGGVRIDPAEIARQKKIEQQAKEMTAKYESIKARFDELSGK